MSGAIAVTTAVIAIGVAAEVGTTFAIVAAVGATVAAIGTVAHVKELQYAGMALGAVGGIGALATSAGMFAGEAASFASEATDAASWVGDVTAAAAPEGGYTMANLAESGLPGGVTGFDASALPAAAPPNPSLDVINQVNGLPPGGNESIAPGSSGAMGDIPDASAPNPTPAVANDTGAAASAQAVPDASSGTGTALVDQPAAPATSVPSKEPALTSTITTTPADTAPVTGAPSASPAGPVTGANTGPVNGQVPGVPGQVQAPAGQMPPMVMTSATTTPSGPPGFPGGAPNGPTSIWDDIMKTVGQPGVGTLLSGAVQAGGAFIAGATSTLTPAQIKALNAQAEANQAAANLANQNAGLAERQLKNLQSPIPVAYRKPDPGLVNQSSPVTGQVSV